ncbi:hypothetical protein BESB_010440 [Besnoitia besnoiti]|uniref:Uncharacterized protein n=1 Tax=Besnoitia besnoiti TaxID=94643 RepID=A0A2A9MR18_BESBE|nr:hypothetical protein BESB_010440 [Besnoitia besnoiti]PFH38702.1 hypothetical protein BESB_010440 [Besnoitia besnoiti]
MAPTFEYDAGEAEAGSDGGEPATVAAEGLSFRDGASSENAGTVRSDLSGTLQSPSSVTLSKRHEAAKRVPCRGVSFSSSPIASRTRRLGGRSGWYGCNLTGSYGASGTPPLRAQRIVARKGSSSYMGFALDRQGTRRSDDMTCLSQCERGTCGTGTTSTPLNNAALTTGLFSIPTAIMVQDDQRWSYGLTGEEGRCSEASHSSLACWFVRQMQAETAYGINPVRSAKTVLWLCAVSALFFICMGAWLLVEDTHHIECKLNYEYNEDGSRYMLKGISGAHCTRDVAELEGPVINVYVEMQNFFQNDAQVVWSRSARQLAGTIFTRPEDVRECEPLVTAIVEHVQKVLHPCGVLAWNVLTDKFQFLAGMPDGDNDEVPIALLPLNQAQHVLLESWPWQDMYKNPARDERAAVLDKVYFWMSADDNAADERTHKSREEARAELLVDRLNYEEAGEMVENGHFIQWMQTAALGTFRKLYGRLEGPLKLPVSAHITVMLDVMSWNGKKAIVLVQNSRFGGRSLFIGLAYITLGCVLSMFVFVLLWKMWQGPRGGEKSGTTRWEQKFSKESEKMD